MSDHHDALCFANNIQPFLPSSTSHCWIESPLTATRGGRGSWAPPPFLNCDDVAPAQVTSGGAHALSHSLGLHAHFPCLVPQHLNTPFPISRVLRSRHRTVRWLSSSFDRVFGDSLASFQCHRQPQHPNHRLSSSRPTARQNKTVHTHRIPPSLLLTHLYHCEAAQRWWCGMAVGRPQPTLTITSANISFRANSVAPPTTSSSAATPSPPWVVAVQHTARSIRVPSIPIPLLPAWRRQWRRKWWVPRRIRYKC